MSNRIEVFWRTVDRESERRPRAAEAAAGGGEGQQSGQAWRELGGFSVPSQRGNEQLALQKVARAIEGLPISPGKIERIKTAVAEATMNAMEHGNKFNADLPVQIRVRASDTVLSINITDEGGSERIPSPETPDLEAKLEGYQSPRGWGLFLIKKMVDRMNITRNESEHTVELIVYLEGEQHASESA